MFYQFYFNSYFKDNCLVNFLLMGISCPRSSKPGINGNVPVEAEPYGNEALNFVKEKVFISTCMAFLSKLLLRSYLDLST